MEIEKWVKHSSQNQDSSHLGKEMRQVQVILSFNILNNITNKSHYGKTEKGEVASG